MRTLIATAIQARIAGFVNLTLSSRTKGGEDLVWAELGPAVKVMV